MKTILVLTDFSINADYAAHYALKFAQKIKADLLLCNIYTVPPNDKNPEPNAWPLNKHEENSIDDLGELLARLKTQVDAGPTSDFRPDINQCSQEGSVTDTINDIATKNNIFMAIISIHSASYLTTIFSENHTREIIEKANFPVLIIPYQVRYKDYKTIAFATDLTETDTDVLRSLSTLASYSDSEILITNVSNHDTAVQEEENSLKKFFGEEVLKIANPKILYKAIKSRSVGDSLRWLSQHIEIDMVVLVHRKQNLFQKLTEGSIIKKMADHPSKPLLIYPYSTIKESLPVF
jgi:nucleotide-binding universal stress UspA family protein